MLQQDRTGSEGETEGLQEALLRSGTYTQARRHPLSLVRGSSVAGESTQINSESSKQKITRLAAGRAGDRGEMKTS